MLLFCFLSVSSLHSLSSHNPFFSFFFSFVFAPSLLSIPSSLFYIFFNPIALRTAKTPSSFGRSECNRVKPPFPVLHLFSIFAVSLHLPSYLCVLFCSLFLKFPICSLSLSSACICSVTFLSLLFSLKFHSICSVLSVCALYLCSASSNFALFSKFSIRLLFLFFSFALSYLSSICKVFVFAFLLHPYSLFYFLSPPLFS